MHAALLCRRGSAWLVRFHPSASRALLPASAAGGARRWLVGTVASAGSAFPSWTTTSWKKQASAEAPPAHRGVGRAARGGPTVLLVESPAKAKKIQQFLGPDYTVLATYGHIRDLPARKGSVDPGAGFEMKWEVMLAAQERLRGIAVAVQHTSRLVLAADPDREGEAISWHLLQELTARRALCKSCPTQRITFTEVTKSAVLEALSQPRDICEPLVHAYMARRALDYLFGFNLSPLLWRKVPAARSAGRVQSVTLRLVCEREAAIEAFQRQKYFTVEASLELPGGGAIEARLAAVDGAPPPKPGFADQEHADAVAARVATAQFSVQEASSREQQRQPPPPFITSTLQQEASTRLGFGASRTMQLAQQLYDAGHITYMRTDGVSLSAAAVEGLREAAAAAHGPAFVPPEPRVFKSRAKNAQEAHEAIRPTAPLLTPEQLAVLGVEEAAAKLYGLIRNRALACQMSPATLALLRADLASSDGTLQLRATASAVAFPGFLAAYFDSAAFASAGFADEAGNTEPAEQEALVDEVQGGPAGAARRQAEQQAARAAAVAGLSALQRGQAVTVGGAAASEHETQPPARFTEGSLVKALEELGIGRPSTYAPTLNTLQARRRRARGYMRKEGRALHAEALGRVLSAFLQAYFPQYVDYGFTSGLEAQLDAVSGGSISWQDVLSRFWEPFTADLATVAEVPVTEVIDKLNDSIGDQLIGKDRTCPACGGQLSIKMSSKLNAAPFVGCTQYPACTFARPIDASWLEEEDAAGDIGAAEDMQVAADNSEWAKLTEGLPGYARLLGTDHDTGLPVFVRSGLYGPYVQRGMQGEECFRRQALPKNTGHRMVTLQMALSMLALPKDLGPNPATGDSVLVSMGKFGPFIRCGALSRAVPKAYDPIKLTLADALQVLATNHRYNTGKEARKVAQANAKSEAGYGTAEPAAAVEPSPPKKRGRLSNAQKLADAAAEASQQTAEPSAAQPPPPKKRGRPSNAQKLADAAAEASRQAAVLSAAQAPPSKKKMGRPSSSLKAAEAAAAAKNQAAARGTPGLGGEAPNSEQQAARARADARLALDAAAELEVSQLQVALGMEGAGGSQAAEQWAANHQGPSGFNLFFDGMVAEAERRNEKWWKGSTFAAAVGQRWQKLTIRERAAYEAEAAAARLELAAHACRLLPEDRSVGGLSRGERATLAADLATREADKSVDKVLKKRLTLPRPRTAYNFFTAARIAEVKQQHPNLAGSDLMLRMAELWRSSTAMEKTDLKRIADEENKAYKEAKAVITQQQQTATAAAVAAGMSSIEAARAGMLAGQPLIEAYLQQRQKRWTGIADK